MLTAVFSLHKLVLSELAEKASRHTGLRPSLYVDVNNQSCLHALIDLIDSMKNSLVFGNLESCCYFYLFSGLSA